MSDWIQWAILFHNTYESFAPEFGYETRDDTKEFDPESKNGKLMIKVCRLVISQALTQQKKQLRDKVEGMEMPVPAPLTKKKYEAGSRIIGYNQALKDVIKLLGEL